MSLDVHGLVNSGRMEPPECILCGPCVDICSKGAIRFTVQTPARQVSEFSDTVEPAPVPLRAKAKKVVAL